LRTGGATSCFNASDGVYGSAPEPVIGPAIAGPVGGDDPARREAAVIAKFLADETGATAIEYCPIACGIAFAIIAVVQGTGPQLSTKFTAVNSSLK
jgi:pilus assembly protein Flp/PilA